MAVLMSSCLARHYVYLAVGIRIAVGPVVCIKTSSPPGWSEFVCQHCNANAQLWIDADRCWLGSEEQQPPTPGTDGLGRGVGCWKSVENEHFFILANGVSCVHGEVTWWNKLTSLPGNARWCPGIPLIIQPGDFWRSRPSKASVEVWVSGITG